MKKLIQQYSILFGLLLIAVCLVVIRYAPGSGDVADGFTRLVLSALLLALMYYLGGKKAVLPTRAGFGKTIHGALVALVSSGIFMLFLLLVAIFFSHADMSGWLATTLSCTFMYMMVGVFEEVLFRGLVFGAFLNRLGGTKGGVCASLMLSSFLFGLVHVIFSLVDGQLTFSRFAMAMLKIITTAQFGLLLASLCILYRNLWAVALVHGINDLCLALGAAFNSVAITGDYVSGGNTSKYIFSLIMIVIYLPFNIIYLRKALQEPLPQYGFFRAEEEQSDSRRKSS